MLTRFLPSAAGRAAQRGTTLLEVLVTIVILTVGLLGLAGLQSQTLIAEQEAFQRAQAVLLMNDMLDRISTNRTNAASYVFTGTLGTAVPSVTASVDCSAAALVSATQVQKDQCDWSNELTGATETTGTGLNKKTVGGMVNGRGCVELVTAQNAASGICTPGTYKVTVVWQGSSLSSIPAATCGSNLYGAEGYRRAVFAQVSVGLPTCS